MECAGLSKRKIQSPTAPTDLRQAKRNQEKNGRKPFNLNKYGQEFDTSRSRQGIPGYIFTWSAALKKFPATIDATGKCGCDRPGT